MNRNTKLRCVFVLFYLQNSFSRPSSFIKKLIYGITTDRKEGNSEEDNGDEEEDKDHVDKGDENKDMERNEWKTGEKKKERQMKRSVGVHRVVLW